MSMENIYFTESHSAPKPELPLLKNFCCCYPIDVGINFIALTDLLMSMIWFTMFFVAIETGMWPFYVLYLVVSILRINYFVQFIQNDSELTRRNNYYSQIGSTAAFVVIYLLHLIVSWSKFGEFPGVFLLYEIFSTGQLMYNILVVRQHYQNYD